MARIRAAQGYRDGALDLLDEESVCYWCFLMAPSVLSRVLAQGRIGLKPRWAREQGLSAQTTSAMGANSAHHPGQAALVPSKSDRADRSMREAVGLLERLLQAAEAASGREA